MDSPAVLVAMVIVFTWVAVELIGLFGAKFGGRHIGLLGRLRKKKKPHEA